MASQASRDLSHRSKNTESEFKHPAVSHETIHKVARLLNNSNHAYILHDAVSRKKYDLQYSHGKDSSEVKKMSGLQDILKHKI